MHQLRDGISKNYKGGFFDDIWQKYTKDSRIEFVCLS